MCSGKLLSQEVYDPFSNVYLNLECILTWLCSVGGCSVGGGWWLVV